MSGLLWLVLVGCPSDPTHTPQDNDADTALESSPPVGWLAVEESGDTGKEEPPCARTAWWADLDRDGYGAGPPTMGCEAPDGHVDIDGDCDDTDPAVAPDRPEICDNLDNDCDNEIDEGAIDAQRWYRDADGDGEGIRSDYIDGCAADGYVDTHGDCDDADPSMNTYGEGCDCRDGLDNDKDGLIDCEEAICAGSEDCTELDCSDGRDSDRDGLTDCDDEDCWGDAGCPGASYTARVHSGQLRQQHRQVDRRACRISPCYIASTFSATSTATSVRGSVLQVNLRDETSATCGWSLTRAQWASRRTSMALSSEYYHGEQYWSYSDVVRSGFALSSGCPFSVGTSVLPARLSSGGAVVHHRSSCRAQWYAPATTTVTSSRSGSASWYSSAAWRSASSWHSAARTGSIGEGSPFSSYACP